MAYYSWFKVYHDMADNKKLKHVAQRTHQPMASVIGVWVSILESASDNKTNRGVIPYFEGFEEFIAIKMELSTDVVEAMFLVMEDVELISSKTAEVCGWETAQSREGYAGVSAGALRARSYRARKREEAKKGGKIDDVRNASNAKRNACNALRNEDIDIDIDIELDKEERIKNKEKEREKKKAKSLESKTKNKKRHTAAKPITKVSTQQGLAKQKPDARFDPNKVLQTMVDAWNDKVAKPRGDKRLAKLTPKIAELLTVVWLGEFNEDILEYEYYLEIITKSEFLSGKMAGKDFAPNLAWVLKEENIEKVYGGVYGRNWPDAIPQCHAPTAQENWVKFIRHFKNESAWFVVKRMELVRIEYGEEGCGHVVLHYQGNGGQTLPWHEKAISEFWLEQANCTCQIDCEESTHAA